VWLRLAAVSLAVAAALLLALSGLGARFGVWSFATGFLLLRAAAYVGLAACAAALIALALPRYRSGWIVLALIVGAVSAYLPWHHYSRARSVPPINDISTDTETPPEFVALLARRARAPVPPGYDPKMAPLQRQAYPDIQPLTIAVPRETGFARALAAAEAMRWQLVASDAAAGRIEATATTFWFGFKDDIVIRVSGAPGGSRIDVRSKSRVGVSDTGTNAQRIRAFLERVK
jgi:uncharacterized protein (DUF1499 family)